MRRPFAFGPGQPLYRNMTERDRAAITSTATTASRISMAVFMATSFHFSFFQL